MKRTGLILATCVTAAAISACGGGSGGSSTPPPTSTTISGTAAAGSPIVGTITVQDSSTPAKTRQTSILADGKYSIDVAGMTGPFMLRADGAVAGVEVHLYSGAVQADVGGTINVTPFTDLVLSNIAGALAKTYFDSQGYKTLAADAIAANSGALKARLLPVLQALGVSGAIDLMRISFSADSTGFDRVMDIVKVSVDPVSQVATIRNVITGQQITNDLKTQSYLGVLDNVTNLADLALIDNQLKKFAALFATSIPLPTNPDLVALFDQQGFMNQGADLGAFLADLTLNAPVGIQFANVRIESVQGNVARITFSAFDKNGASLGDPLSWEVVKVNGAWLLRGDQRIGQVKAKVTAVWQQGTGALDGTGLWLGAYDPYGRFDSARVTGPGLTGTITLTKTIADENFQIAGMAPVVWLSEAAIGSIPDDGATYRFSLYAGSVLQATYDVTVGKRPYKPSELSGAMFPVISSATDAALTSFNGGMLPVSWTLPPSLKPYSLSVSIGDANGVHVNEVFYDLTWTAPPAVVSLPAVTATGQAFTPTWRDIHMSGTDIFGRELLTSLHR